MSLDTYPVAKVEAMQARLAALEAENKALRDRLAEEDTVKNAALNCVREATGAVMRLAPLEAEAKQARDDEAWAHLHAVPILRRGEVWVAEHFDGRQIRYAEAATIHAALRALRAKVEGGTR